MELSDGKLETGFQIVSTHDPTPTAPELLKRAWGGLTKLNEILLGDDCKLVPSLSLPMYHSTVQGVTVVNTVIGSFALQVWDPSEPVLCSMAGTPSEDTFYSLAGQKLLKSRSHGVQFLRADRQALRMFELDIDGILFAIHYHQAYFTPGEPYINTLLLPSGVGTSSMSAEKRIHYQQAVFMQQNVRDLDVFQASYRWIKNWALKKGLYSSRFSYLSEPLLLAMVSLTICQTTQSTSWQSVCASFFRFWSRIDPEKRVIVPHETALFRLRVNPADGTTRSTWMTIVDELKAAHQVLVVGSTINDISSFNELDFNMGSDDDHWHHVRVDLSYWGHSQDRCGRFVNMLEDEMAVLVTKISRIDVHPRVWPRRMISTNAPTGVYEASYYIVFYYNKHKRAYFRDIITTTYLTRFEALVRASPKYDEKNMSISLEAADLLPSSEGLKTDDKDWSLVPDKQDFNEEFSDPDDGDTIIERTPSPIPSMPSHSPQAPAKPLRPALDVLNRIRHDGNLDEDDYLIGYLDRHSGMMTIPVSSWKAGDATDQDFIPQSRVQYFERKSDGVRIWDRAKRLDRMFGSGRPVEGGGRVEEGVKAEGW